MRLIILAFAFGVLLLQMQATLPDWQSWAVGGVLLLLPRFRSSRWLARSFAILGCLLLGLAWGAWRAEVRLADYLATENEGVDVEIVGVIASLPQDFSHGTRFEFAVERTSTVAFAVPERIMLSWYKGRQSGEISDPATTALLPGERWRLVVRLKRPHGNANPGGFDYEAWLLERNIRATGYVRNDPPMRLAEMVWRPGYMIERLRYRVRASFAEVLPAANYPLAGVLVALTIGDQKSIHGDLWATFNRTGTTHLMSICYLLKHCLA